MSLTEIVLLFRESKKSLEREDLSFTILQTKYFSDEQ